MPHTTKSPSVSLEEHVRNGFYHYTIRRGRAALSDGSVNLDLVSLDQARAFAEGIRAAAESTFQIKGVPQ